jgi:hypothetical protein
MESSMARTRQFVQFAMVLGLMALVLFGCGQEPTSATQPQQVTMEASWAEWYTDLHTLKAHSDVVVVGTIASIASAAKNQGVPFTVFKLSVTQVLYDKAQRITDNSLLLNQTGGFFDGVRYSTDDDPLFVIGEQSVLFLRFDPATKLFFVIGGPSGRFRVTNDIVTPIVNNGVKIAATTHLNAFVASAQAA